MDGEYYGIKYTALDRLETYEVGRCDRRGEPEPSKITSFTRNFSRSPTISKLFIFKFFYLSLPNENTLHKA